MRIYPDADCNGEVASHRRTERPKDRHASERNTLRFRMQRCTYSSRRIAWKSKIMGQGIRRAHRNYAQCGLAAHHSLQHVVDSAVAAASKHGVASIHNGLSSLFRSVDAGLRPYQGRCDACIAQNFQDPFQVGIALPAATTRARVVEKSSLAHAGELTGLQDFEPHTTGRKIVAAISTDRLVGRAPYVRVIVRQATRRRNRLQHIVSITKCALSLTGLREPIAEPVHF